MYHNEHYKHYSVFKEEIFALRLLRVKHLYTKSLDSWDQNAELHSDNFHLVKAHMYMILCSYLALHWTFLLILFVIVNVMKYLLIPGHPRSRTFWSGKLREACDRNNSISSENRIKGGDVLNQHLFNEINNEVVQKGTGKK